MSGVFPQVLNKDQILLQVLFTTLQSFHVQPTSLDDTFSEETYTLYLKWIDPQKKVFLQSDIEALSVHKYRIDDEIKQGSFAFFDQIIDIWRARLAALEPKVMGLVDEPVDFFSNEFVDLDRDDQNLYAESESDQLDYWRRQLKYRLMSLYLDIAEDAINSTQNVTIATLDDPIVIDPEILVTSQKKIKEDLIQLFKNFKSESDENLKNLYVNALLSSYDSHTSYFPIDKKEDFDISISGQLEGIGAVLSEKDNFIVVDRIIAGGAASRQGLLSANDKILKVAQGEQGVYENIIGRRVRDAVKLIRGKKGTTVRLWVKKSDDTTEEIVLVRDVVLIEDTFAKAAIIENNKLGIKTGYIYLPKFYRDFNHKDGRNSSGDVRKLLDSFQKEDISGVVLDLRNNEGGALMDAVQVAGLFIEEGPVVQVKDRKRSVTVYRDLDRDILYNGPLLILINHYSASAAEIVSAALQDYGRAVIVGATSYGKGTVQTFLDLQRLYPGPAKLNPDLGSLKMTIQKFYRVSGESTQLKGVLPDILLPDTDFYLEVGEKYLDNPLAWDKIRADHFKMVPKTFDVSALRKQSRVRLQDDVKFLSYQRYFDFMKLRSDKKQISLRIDHQIQQRRRLERIKKDRDEHSKEFSHLSFVSLAKNNEWLDPLKKDIYLYEGLSVLYDMIQDD